MLSKNQGVRTEVPGSLSDPQQNEQTPHRDLLTMPGMTAAIEITRSITDPLFRSFILLCFLSMLIPCTALSAQSERPQMLVVDYAMGYPEENAGVMSVFTEAGYDVDYRQYYPGLVGSDAGAYDAILLMGGGDPGMSVQEVDFAINFVSRGKLLMLAVPPDSEFGGDRATDAGTHDRHMFNTILSRLNINMYAYAPPVQKGVVLTPVISYELMDEHETAQGLSGPLRLRADTSVLVGDDVLPLLLEPESDEKTGQLTEAEPEERQVKMVRHRVRILPQNAYPDEEIELLLRGLNRLRPQLHYRSGREPVPVEWNTEEFQGRVVAVKGDTVTVRVAGNRWGSEYAIVDVPSSVVAIAFVRREMLEEIDPEDGGEDVALSETGRMAVVAGGRGDRLDKGVVAVADRRLLNTLSGPTTPVSLVAADLPDPLRTARFLTQTARYLRALTANPENWSPENPHPKARIPGLREPDFPVNKIELLPRLPPRVTVTTNRTIPNDFLNKGISNPGTSVRGIWDYIIRMNARMDSLLTLITDQDYNLLWTVAPARSFAAPDSDVMESMQLATWGRRIASHLSGASVDWYAGIALPEEVDDGYVEAVDARGREVGMPSPFDLKYWESEYITPSRKLAEFARMNPALKGIIHDWETHINRFNWISAATDAFGDEPFRQFLTHLVHHGWYGGREFDTFKKLGRKRRYEWMLKSGRLEMYFRFLEDRAEKLGILYRETIEKTNENLRHGGFMRSPRLSWFHIGFWRGLNHPSHPMLLVTYEPVPVWYVRMLADRGVNVQSVPLALLGLIPSNSYNVVLDGADRHGGYILERGIWLVSEPEDPDDVTAPQR